MKWISVKDRLPELDYLKKYVCCNKHSAIFIAWRDIDGFYEIVNNDRMGVIVDYWMALPEPPKEEDYFDYDNPDAYDSLTYLR